MSKENAFAVENGAAMVARARAIREKQEAQARLQLAEAAQHDRCWKALSEFNAKIKALFEDYNPIFNSPQFDATPFLPSILIALNETCRVFQSCELNQKWQSIDREATFGHYRAGYARPDEARVAFDWGCHLVDLGFAGALQDEQIKIAWDEPTLRGSFGLAAILLGGLMGTHKVIYREQNGVAEGDETPRLFSLLDVSDRRRLAILQERLRSVPASIESLIGWRKWLGDRLVTSGSDVTDVLLIWDDTKKRIPEYQSLDESNHIHFRIEDGEYVRSRPIRQFLGEIEFEGPREHVSLLMTWQLLSQARDLVQECEDWLIVAARERGIVGVAGKLDDSAIRQLDVAIRNEAAKTAAAISKGIAIPSAQASDASCKPALGMPDVRFFIDEIDTFNHVRNLAPGAADRLLGKHGFLDKSEEEIQLALERIIGEPFHKQDWGGETNDLYTTNIRINGTRIPTAFLLKGNGLRRKAMRIADCGANGDQIVRLFDSPAELFVVQFVGNVDENLIRDLEGKVELARAKGRRASCCVINGQDTARLLLAYEVS